VYLIYVEGILMNHRMFTENDMIEDKMYNLDNTSYFVDDLDTENISMDEKLRDNDTDMEYFMDDYEEMNDEMQGCMGCSRMPCMMNMQCMENNIGMANSPNMDNNYEMNPYKMMKDNPMMQHNMQHQMMPYMVEIEEDEECDSDDVKDILEKMEKKNPEIFTFMSAYGIPYPIIKKALKNRRKRKVM
jgi:DNA integrity scanning protein DisA with diadenylate cyclase activity